MLKQIYYTLIISVYCFSTLSCTTHNTAAKEIDIMLFGGHPLLKSVQFGVENQFRKRLLADGKDSTLYNFQIFDAGFKPSNSIQQTRIAFEQKPSAFLALGTPSISALLSQTDNVTPLFFGATNDPFKLGFTKDSSSSNYQNIQLTAAKNVSGYVSAFDFSGLSSLIVAVSELNKSDKIKSKLIGYPITTTENNSKVALHIIRSELEKMGYKAIESPITSSNETMRAARDLMDRNVDLILVGPDNTVVGGMSSILAATQGYNIPVLASDRETVNKGAICAVGIDFIKLGESLGDMIYDKLENKKVTSKNVSWFSDNKLFINRQELVNQLGDSSQNVLIEFAKTKGLPVEFVN